MPVFCSMICAERPPVGDPVQPLDVAQLRIVQVEEPVSVAQRLELLPPHRKLQLAELRPTHVTLGEHPDECVELVGVSVDRLQPCGEGGAANAHDGLGVRRLAPELDRIPVGVEERDEVEDVRVVDRVAR